MDRDEFMELVYETFTDEPDNVLANGIIEAADAYVEREKAQLSKERTTSDLISRTETVEHLRRMLEATVPNTDYDEGFIDGVEFGISTVSTMPTIQPQSTTGQLNDGAQSTARSTDLIERQAAIDAVEKNACNTQRIMDAVNNLPPAQPEVLACGSGELVAQPEPTDIDAKEAVYNLAEKIGIHQLFALTVELRGEPIQPELTYEQVEEYCKRRCLHIVTADFFESTKPQRLGHWVDGRCNECGGQAPFWVMSSTYYESDFCPHCGAKMTTSTK